jgi:hypothetical protein
MQGLGVSFSSQLSALSSPLAQMAASALAESRVKIGYVMIVRRKAVIICKTICKIWSGKTGSGEDFQVWRKICA